MNPYNLQIKSNFYKTPDQYEGNGVYAFYTEGCIDNKYYFRAYYLNGVVYLEAGPSYENRYIKKRRTIEMEHFNMIEVVPEIFISYVNQLLDEYLEEI